VAKDRAMKIDPADIRRGPIRHERLSDALVSRVRAIRAALLSVYPHTMEFWLDGFKRDVEPEKEVLWWEHISACFLEYFSTKRPDEEQAKSAFRLLMQIGLDGAAPSEFENLPEDDVDFLKRAAAFVYPPPDSDDERL
jgi:hypothetical protein